MPIAVYIRRNGRVIATFDRKDYLSAMAQGGIRDDDEWTHADGREGGQWFRMSDFQPFSSATGKKGLSERHHQYDQRNLAFEFALMGQKMRPALIESVSISGFGFFGSEKTIHFEHSSPEIKVLALRTYQWLATNGSGKTTLGLAFEMARDVAMGRPVCQQAGRMLHADKRAELSFRCRFNGGVEILRLTIEGRSPKLEASDTLREKLKRIRYLSVERILDLYSSPYFADKLPRDDFEHIRLQWLKVYPFFPKQADSTADSGTLRERLTGAPFGEKIVTGILLMMRDAIRDDSVLVLEDITSGLDTQVRGRILDLLSQATERGVWQIIMLDTL